jgi:hypothetical protein
MMRRAGMLLAVMTLVLPAATWPQAKPDFSGMWKLATSEPANYRGASATWGAPSPMLVIKQSPTDITVEGDTFTKGQLKLTYKLDGSDLIWEAPWTSAAGVSTVVKWRTKARWDGNKLVLYTWNTALNQLRDTMSLTGGQIVIVRGTEVPGGSSNATLTYSKGA